MNKLSLRFGMAAAFLAAVLFSGASISAAELTLADGGRTDYRVVTAKNASLVDRGAAADLAATLKEITGADFSDTFGKTRTIFIGVPAPGDKKPLKKFERRVVSQDGNVYIYGEGKYGNNNAVYDFLRDELGCRWFNVAGDKKIPKSPKLVIGELKKSLVPSIPYMTAGRVNDRAPCVLIFARRNAIVHEKEIFIDGDYPLHLHALQRFIPSGKIPCGSVINNIAGPLKCLKNKAYFDTHPEWFSLDVDGKRTCWRQLCLSNMEMRDEFMRNLEIAIKADNYKGGRKLLSVSQDDKSGPFCFCSNCKALEKKYGHPAGAYYDFLFDLSARFAKKYPEILLCFLAYRDNQTLYPAKCMKKLPANLLPSYAPLGCDFTKPLNYRPTNAIQEDCFRKWASVAEQLHWWSYPAPYPRPILSFPLIANIHRIAENFRLAHQCKVNYAYCQYGAGLYSNYGFNDLRTYLLAQLCRDITLDEKKVISEYAEGCYGKAAPLMLKYIAELEKLEAETPVYMRWNPDVRILPYTTGANLLRWERDFDAMENLVRDDARALLNVRRARYNLDQTLIAKWPWLTPEEIKAAGDLEKLIARAEQTISDDLNDLYRKELRRAPGKYRKMVNGSLKWHRSGLDQFSARARGGKPLPAEFAKYKKLYRILPERNMKALDMDPDAPFGLAVKGRFRSEMPSWFHLRSYDSKRIPNWLNVELSRPFNAKNAEGRLDGKYHYLSLGPVMIEEFSQLRLWAVESSADFCLSQLFDRERPHRLYDLHILIAFAPDKSWVKVAELVVIPLDEDANPAPVKARKDTQDEFV